MSDHAPDTKNTPTDIPQSDAVDHSRRKLAGAALGAGAVFTLASRPVWANQCTISGMASGNLSTPAGVTCAGCTPGYWINHPKNWPSDYLPGTCLECNNGNKCKEWDDDGSSFPFSSTTYDGKTMMQVLAMEGNEDKFQLGAHAIAALLNAATTYPQGYSFGYSVGDITDLWTRYSGDPEGLKKIYASLNERFCPLGNENPAEQCTVSVGSLATESRGNSHSNKRP